MWSRASSNGAAVCPTPRKSTLPLPRRTAQAAQVKQLEMEVQILRQNGMDADDELTRSLEGRELALDEKMSAIEDENMG